MKLQRARYGSSTSSPTAARPVAHLPFRSAADPRSWALWRAPARVVAYVLAVDTLAVVLTVALATADHIGRADVVVFALLVLGSTVHIEVARHIERLREVGAEGRPYVDLKSMWTFAGLLMLPVGLAVALVLTTFAYWWTRVSQRPVPHRWAFSGATAVLGTIAAWGVTRALSGADVHALAGPIGLLVVCGGALVRWLVNHGLVAGVICLTAPGTSWLKRLGAPTDNLLGLGALALGAILAVLSDTAPWLVPVLLVPIMVMHRGILLQQLARTALTDDKTGLATSTHWHASATRELARARRHHLGVGVLMVDLDDFKGVNDRWGHLVGDQVLRAVAEVLTAEVRAQDAVGRFGGEEFVLLLTDVDATGIARTAERLRERTTTISVPVATHDSHAGSTAVTGLSISIGTAMFPDTADRLDDLVLAADTALYDAKRSGRNRVCAAPRPAALPSGPTGTPGSR